MPFEKKSPRPEKISEVNELKELLSHNTIILTNYQGMDVKVLAEFRKKLKDAGSKYRVVKNTLLKIASEGTAAEELLKDLAGPTAIVYTNDDPVAAAKAVEAFKKVAKTLEMKSGLVDGTAYSASEMEALSKVPSKPELYAMIVGGLLSPITGLIGTLNGMMVQLVGTLQAVAEQKEKAA